MLRNATTWVLAAALAGLTGLVAAPAWADAGGWLTETLVSSPLTAASGEKLECTVKYGSGLLVNGDVRIEHIGENGGVLQSVDRTVPPGGFRSSVYMVPFGGKQAYCKVEYKVWIPCWCDGVVKVDMQLDGNAQVSGNLTRQDAASREQAESELQGLAFDGAAYRVCTDVCTK